VVKKDLILNDTTADPTSLSSHIYHLIITNYTQLNMTLDLSLVAQYFTPSFTEIFLLIKKCEMARHTNNMVMSRHYFLSQEMSVV